MNKFCIALCGISLSATAMELPFEIAATNQAIAKYSGCFVAAKDGWLKGHSLTSDASVAFAYLHPQDATAKNFIGYTVAILKKCSPGQAATYGMCGLCAKPELLIRMATKEEISIAQEKIKADELELVPAGGAKMSLELLKRAAAQMNFSVGSKRKEEGPQPVHAVRTSKRNKRPVKRYTSVFLRK
jgi:hypothetical protein